MQEAVAAVIHSSDIQGKYLDNASIDQLKPFFPRGDVKVQAAQVIREQAAEIVKEAVARSLSQQALQSRSSLQATRYYAAGVRDLDFFLRYTTYALLSGGTAILEQRVLKGLKETYQTLGVTIAVTTEALQALKAVTIEVVGAEAGQEIGIYFDYICDRLS